MYFGNYDPENVHVHRYLRWDGGGQGVEMVNQVLQGFTLHTVRTWRHLATLNVQTQGNGTPGIRQILTHGVATTVGPGHGRGHVMFCRTAASY